MGRMRTIYRSAKTGRFVKKSYATRNPRTTVQERRPFTSSQETNRTVRRSSVTGKFVPKRQVRRTPNTTTTERRRTRKNRRR